MTPAPGTHIVFDRSHAVPGPYRGLVSELMRLPARLFLWANGWKMQGDWPGFAKTVLLAAPHTSNWDGINMLAGAAYYRIGLDWMGKASLTQGPFGWLVKALGCVPVDRSRSNDLVGAMADAFAARAEMVLAIPPEGTRSRTRAWKTGFYQIALQAGVPITFAVLDYGSKTITLSGAIWPSGDYDADLALISTHYAGARGKHADKFTAAKLKP